MLLGRRWVVLLPLSVALALGCAREPASPGPWYPPGDPYGYAPGPYGYGYAYPPGAYPPGGPGYGAWPPGQAPGGPWPGGAAPPSAAAAAAVAFAQARLGTPYCWGGNGPSCFDCSGLTHAAWLAGGKAIPRTSEAQAAKLTPVAMNGLLPGDIVWRPGHVGLYVGGGAVIHAPGSGAFVSYQEAARFERAFRP